MIKKKPVRGTDRVSVTFMTEDQPEAGSVRLLGDFNAWSLERHPMRQRKDGSWAVTVRLPRRGRYEYRYLVDGRHWITDDEGDGIRPNEFGTANSVVTT